MESESYCPGNEGRTCPSSGQHRKRNMAVSQTTDTAFDKDVLKASTPVLVDFWAEWCGPCKMIAPHLEDLAEQYGERLKVAKLDIDDNLDVTTRYAVQAIPTLILFKDGEPVLRLTGARSKSSLEEELS